ncbi:MAG: DASH family cryptochrome [Burkholderiales bacterium]|nr:DASH family cryptochrome [Burkholderiales bacterium]
MKTNIYWFRQDLRLSDSPALRQACVGADNLILIYTHASRYDEQTPWGFARTSRRRREYTEATLQALRRNIETRGNTLLEFTGNPAEILQVLAGNFAVDTIYCEAIEAPEERAELAQLRQLGLRIVDIWQSTMFDPRDLPFTPEQMPDTFTIFRQQIERSDARPRALVQTPTRLPPVVSLERVSLPLRLPTHAAEHLNASPLPAGEDAAYQCVNNYFSTQHPKHYKETRNQILGEHYSTRLSIWLALGSLSATSALTVLKEFEATHGSNDSTYWIFFELLWRDYFRFLHIKYGRRLYLRNGLRADSSAEISHTTALPVQHDNLTNWMAAQTANDFVNAGMTELRQTGFLSNRMRQIVASYLIYDLGVDWRAGAAWFENQLLDFDVYSNQGNWLYIAGLGTDPRGGRRMNMQKQMQEHDPDGSYRTHWRQH